MTGKDLFTALDHVDDALVAEAETYTARRVIPLPAARWMGTLAACFCVLVVWAVLARTGMMGKGLASEKAVMDEAAVENGFFTEDAVCEEEAPETETTEGAAEAPAEAVPKAEEEFAGGAVDEEPSVSEQEDFPYLIFDAAIPEAKQEDAVLYAAPLNGAFILDEEITGTMDQLALVCLAKPPRYLVAFDLYQNEERLDPDSTAYLAEVERLAELGYEFRTLNVPHTDESVQVRICMLCDGAQLVRFAASSEYGYLLYFPKGENGEPLDWFDEVALCGLPNA